MSSCSSLRLFSWTLSISGVVKTFMATLDYAHVFATLHAGRVNGQRIER